MFLGRFLEVPLENLQGCFYKNPYECPSEYLLEGFKQCLAMSLGRLLEMSLQSS